MLLLAPAYGQKMDLNGNGMSDIWETLFQAGALSGSGDADQDGMNNQSEGVAGTDPLSSNSAPRLAFSMLSSSNCSITLPSALGKRYQWETAFATNPVNWTVQSAFVARTGTVVTLSTPLNTKAKWFRLVIADVDTDGDGLNDWEEYKIGLDPLNGSSNGELNFDGQPVGDYAYATNAMASQNVVTITATDPTAMQPDAGQSAMNPGAFTVSRGGFPLNTISVNLTLAAAAAGIAVPNVDHAVLPTFLLLPAGTGSQTIPVTPLSNTNRLNPVVARLFLGGGVNYTIGSANAASVLIYPSATPQGTGLTGQYYTNASATYSNAANFNPANLRLTRLDTNINFTWGTNTVPITNNGWYCVRWTGQVQPQYSEQYFFAANTDDGVRLWVNDQLIVNNWITKGASDSIGSITLEANVRYNIRMEYFQATGGATAKLYWYSPNQAKQLIPTERLYPSATAPSSVTSPLEAVAFLGQPFSNQVTAANSPIRYTAAPLPPGITFNTTNGVLSGIPTLAGEFQITLTTSNVLGVGSSVVNLRVIDTGSSVTREVWINVEGTNVSDIPLGTPATLTNFLGNLEGITDFGDNYGERVRGYITAPTTGNYYFWLAADAGAELWISNDGEPVNKVLRASVRMPTGSRQWNVQPKQKSGWLAMEAGRRYYLEILHKVGTGSDHWAVGWLPDPTGTNFIAPGNGVVPGYVLSRHFPLPTSSIPGTLYAANMVAQNGAVSTAVGTASLRVSPDETQAVLSYQASGFTTAVTAKHIHSDPYLSHPSTIVFDIDDATPQPDGSYVWNITPQGTLSTADIVEIIKLGKSYINIHTINYPAGEIRGNFGLANGTQNFTPPPPPPAWVDDHANSNAAVRFLAQATFGATPTGIASIQSMGYEAWIDDQFLLPTSRLLPVVLSRRNPDPANPFPGSQLVNSWWQQSITAPDQLRQRVAFALSEIMVTSEIGVLQDNGRALSSYYDMLLDNAFGNFRELIEDVTLHPAMGRYLDMVANEKGDMAAGRHPNENYAREVLQLFSVGLYRMWPDGSLVMNSLGELVPTYDQDEIMGFARVFTGWHYWQPLQGNGRLPTGFNPAQNFTNPMVLVPTRHELGTKELLNNVVLPPAWGAEADTTKTNFDIYCSQDLELAHDSIFYNDNVGPFICRQLIQRLVTSHPSRDYLYRVVQKFNDDGTGVRGDMKAVIKAILLDYEARSPVMISQPTFGKQREPLLRVTAAARAFPSPPDLNCTYSQNGNRSITITAPAAHRLNNGDDVVLNYTSSSGVMPANQVYNVETVPSTTTVTVFSPGLVAGNYVQSTNVTMTNMATMTQVTTNIITVFMGAHGLAPGRQVYLAFTGGGAISGLYQVIASTNAGSFVVATDDATTRPTNGCLIPRLNGGGFVKSGTNTTVTIPYTHGLNPGNSVYIDFPAGTIADGTYQVVTVPTVTNFTIIVGGTGNMTDNAQVVYPLVAPPLVRSGNVTIQWSTFNVNVTDTGASASLSQAPLRAPTVFNFFFPDFKFPGALTAAGLTTPEFMLTSDTEVMFQMNFLGSGVGLITSGNNTNGLTSFSSNDGDIVMDIGPWMGTNYTSNAGLPGLVDALSSRLLAGQLSASARTTIINYATTLAYASPPTGAQRRDRARAVIHLLLTSPDFTIQR